MKIQQTPNLQLKSQKQNNTPNNNPNVAFEGSGGLTWFLNFLDTNQTMGATVVDAGCMGIPRSAVDFSRGSDAGIETMRREFSSTLNDAFVGLYGAGAAYFLARSLNDKYGVKAHKIFVSDESLNILAQVREKHGDISNSDKNLNSYLEEIFSSTKGFNPDAVEKSGLAEANIEAAKGWVNIDTTTQKSVVEKFAQELKGNSDELSKESKAYLKALIAGSTGSEKNIKLVKGELTSHSSLDDLIDNVYKVSKTFMSSKVSETFKNGDIAGNEFIKRFKGVNNWTAAIGLAIAAGIGLCVQPFNMYLTKRKTGKSGFVGVEGKEPDKSNKFKLMKGVVGVLGSLLALRSIGKFKEIPAKVKFKGMLPTIDQFKLVYGATIISRIFSARDKNELRETSIKDSLGFVNWLILGGFVSKGVAFLLDKTDKFKDSKFIRYNEKENGTGLFNKLTKSSIVSREEVLHSAFKKANISTIENGVAMTFKEMVKKAPQSAKDKIFYLGLIQFAGYLYSGLVLGIGIPKLNIAITKHFQKQQTANSK